MGWVRFGLSNSNIFPSFAVTWGSSRVHSEKTKNSYSIVRSSRSEEFFKKDPQLC